MFLRDDLDELLACETGPAVSLYLPTHNAGREVRQDAIRLRNMLSEAAKRLGAARRGAETAALLDPARRLVDDEAFWRHQAQSLAVFLAPGFDRIHKLPIEIAEQLKIGSHFAIRPLLPLVDVDGWFWVLTLSAGRTRLYQGSRWGFAEASGLNLPQGIAEVLDETVYEEAHNAAPTGRAARGPSGLARAQSFGDSPEELHKAQLLQLLRRIAAAAEPVVKRRPAPVVLAAAPEMQGNFRDLARWKELLPEGIVENPDAMTAEELHRKAWRLIAPRCEKRRDDELGRLNALLATGNQKAAVKPEDIVKAAHHGRVEQLFLCESGPLWGRFVEAQDRVLAHGTPTEGDEDLLDYAAVMTLRQGGQVSLVDRAQLPPGGPAAAILRY